MPVKHQSDSYRNRGGEHFTCWTDVLTADHRAEARTTVRDMRAKGVRAFAEHVDDEGYSRVFIHQTDAVTAGVLPAQAVVCQELVLSGGAH